MKSILIPQSPEQCEAIISGTQTEIDIRYNIVADMPIKCYIYATWGGNSSKVLFHRCGMYKTYDIRWDDVGLMKNASGKIIGEFTYMGDSLIRDFKVYKTPIPANTLLRWCDSKNCERCVHFDSSKCTNYISTYPKRWCYVKEVNL